MGKQETASKYLPVVQAKREGASTADACKQAGVSVAAFYAWHSQNKRKAKPKMSYSAIPIVEPVIVQGKSLEIKGDADAIADFIGRLAIRLGGTR